MPALDNSPRDQVSASREREVGSAAPLAIAYVPTTRVLNLDLRPVERLEAARRRRGDDQHPRGRVAVVADGSEQAWLDPHERGGAERELASFDHERRRAVEHDEDLLLVAGGLVVLGELVA